MPRRRKAKIDILTVQIKCPHCGNFIKQVTIDSLFWSLTDIVKHHKKYTFLTCQFCNEECKFPKWVVW